MGFAALITPYRACSSWPAAFGTTTATGWWRSTARPCDRHPAAGLSCAHVRPGRSRRPIPRHSGRARRLPPGRGVSPGPAVLPLFGATVPFERPVLPLRAATMPLFSPPMPLERPTMPHLDAEAAAFFAVHGPSRGSVAPPSGRHAPFWRNVGAQSGNAGPFTGTRVPFRGIVAPESAHDGLRTGIDGAFFATDGALTGDSAGQSDEAGSGGCGAESSKRGLRAVACRASIAGACRDGGPGAHPAGLATG